jgi:hypothetical protein
MEKRQFTVVAGKFESDGDMNVKYVEAFATREEADVAFDEHASYPFCLIEGAGGVILRS